MPPLPLQILILMGSPNDAPVMQGAVDGALVFHAGTRDVDGRLVTAGGRVLTVVGRGPSYESATATAYEAASRIRFAGMQYRRDIGQKALAATSSAAR